MAFQLLAPDDPRDSLNRLKELERLSQSEQQPAVQGHQQKWSGYLKSDNLFLLTLATTLICLSCLMVLFAQDRAAHQRIAREEALLASRMLIPSLTREIPLGEFQSIARGAEDNGQVTVIQYEAFVTTRARHDQLNQTELVMLQHKHKLRETVEAVMHKAGPSELREPDLGKLRQTLAQELNQVIGGRKKVYDVQFSNFLYYQIPDTQ